MHLNKIRNFSIIAHVDHGKSTLTDRILSICNAIPEREIKEQMLDSMDIERERGITIKAQTARLKYKDFIFNLIDTPGHSDFSYEVSRALRACEFSILLIAATEGVEAQTISNYLKAVDAGHYVLPVLNKTDLPGANIEKCLEDINNLGLDISLVHSISAKTGTNVPELLDKIIELCPSPVSTIEETRALIIDSWYDKYLGVVTLVRIINGRIKTKQELQALSNGKRFAVLSVGVFTPKPQKIDCLQAGEIGFIVTQIKNSTEIAVGDTLTEVGSQVKPIEGFKKSIPLVFCTFFPENDDEALKTKESLEKYTLNDPAFSFEIESNDLYGLVFRCGFLGILHLDIVRERLERQFDINVTVTLPNVAYHVKFKDTNKIKIIKNANDWPTKDQIEYTEEPEVRCAIMTNNNEYIGRITNLCIDRRAENLNIDTIDGRTMITCKLPLAEIIINFNDKLQSITSGYSSMEYDLIGYRKSNLVKLLILINDKIFEEFSFITHESKARLIGKFFVDKLAEIIPRTHAKIKIQVAIGNIKDIIARRDLSAYKKDVLAKIKSNPGDISRKKKLLEKQKKGSKRHKELYDIAGGVVKNAIKALLKFDM